MPNTSKKKTIAQRHKERWIKDTREFQIIARSGSSDSDEVLGAHYDQMIKEQQLRREERRNRR